MEAARALAAAGHRVSLFEASERLGGQFRMACRIPGKEDFAGTITYFEAELERLGVTVRLGTAVREAGALAGFDCVVVATGVLPRPVELPGADLPHVVSYAELLHGSAWGESVAIIGAGGIGVDVAHLVSHRTRGLLHVVRPRPAGRASPPPPRPRRAGAPGRRAPGRRAPRRRAPGHRARRVPHRHGSR